MQHSDLNDSMAYFSAFFLCFFLAIFSSETKGVNKTQESTGGWVKSSDLLLNENGSMTVTEHTLPCDAANCDYSLISQFATTNTSDSSTANSCTSEKMLVHNEYLGACGYTQETTFSLTKDSYINRIRVWYDSSVGGQNPIVSLSGSDGYYSSTSSLSIGNNQGSWQEGLWDMNEILQAGTYTLKADNASICANPSGDTTLILYGCETSELSTGDDNQTDNTDNTSTDTDSTNSDENNNSSELTPINNLDELIPFPLLFDNAPLIYRHDEPLGMSGVSMINSWAYINGDTVRIINTLLDEQAIYMNFVLNLEDIKFVFGSFGSGNGNESFGSELPGMSVSSDISDVILYGPPLAMDIIPFKIGTESWAASFLFNNETLSFDLQWALPLSSEFSELLDDYQFSSRTNTRIFFSKSRPATIDEYIEEKIKVDLNIPGSAEWRGVAQKCGSAVVSTILPGSSLAETISKAMVDKGNKVWEDMRYHYQRGDRKAALQAYGQFAWVIAVESATSESDMINVLKALASALGEDLPTAAGESTQCKDSNQHIMKAMLNSLSVKALDTLSSTPIGSILNCIAEGTYQIGAAVRSWGNEKIVKAFYQQWKKLEDSESGSGDNLFTGDSVVVSSLLDGAVGYYARNVFNGDRVESENHLKYLFKRWYIEEDSSSELKTQLETMKSLYQSLDSNTLAAIKKNLADDSNEADAFARFEEIFSKTRAQIIPYVPDHYSDDLVNTTIINQILYKWGQEGKNAKAQDWKNAIEEKLIEWKPELFVETPQVCDLADSNDQSYQLNCTVYTDKVSFGSAQSACKSQGLRLPASTELDLAAKACRSASGDSTQETCTLKCYNGDELPSSLWVSESEKVLNPQNSTYSTQGGIYWPHEGIFKGYADSSYRAKYACF